MPEYVVVKRCSDAGSFFAADLADALVKAKEKGDAGRLALFVDHPIPAPGIETSPAGMVERDDQTLPAE